MWTDLQTILWRDVRTFMAQFENPRRFVLGVFASALILVFIASATGIGEWLDNGNPWIFIWIWCWLPLGSAVTLATDAIAGERERHTLETLLATRLPSRALALGKILSIVIQAWISAVLLGFGALLIINIPAILSGEIILLPWPIVVVGPPLSLGFTFAAVTVALGISASAATVRQANFRILAATTILPLLFFVLLLMVALTAVVVYAGLHAVSGFQIPLAGFETDRLTLVLIGLPALGLLGAFTSGLFMFSLSRFERHRLMDVESDPKQSEHLPDEGRIDKISDRFVPKRLSFLADGMSRPARSQANWRRVASDARIVAWKELTEAKGLLYDVRGWIVLVGLVLALIALQLTAVGSWYWSRDAAFSILFWLAMFGGLPLIIAQRSADAIAGERERHTGEVLFTTRLSHTGIVIGKLAVNALVPWAALLSLPIIGIVATNLFYASKGPFIYPVKVFAAGAGASLGFALLLAAGGMLISMGSPTVQHAARRMSWFLMPLLLAPGLALRRSLLMEDMDGVNSEGSAAFELIASGRVSDMLLVGLPLVILVSSLVTLLIVKRFGREHFYFN